MGLPKYILNNRSEIPNQRSKGQDSFRPGARAVRRLRNQEGVGVEVRWGCAAEHSRSRCVRKRLEGRTCQFCEQAKKEADAIYVSCFIPNRMGGHRIRDSLNICASTRPGGSQSKLVTARDVQIQCSARRRIRPTPFGEERWTGPSPE
jgi:hypothetical protein